MVAFLSQEWLDLLRTASGAVPVNAGDARPASVVIRHVVSSGPSGTLVYVTRLESGCIIEATVGDVDDADLSISMSYDDAVCLIQGEVSVGAAYMQGRLKVEGDMAMLFELLPCTHRPEYRAFVAKVANDTTFPEVPVDR